MHQLQSLLEASHPSATFRNSLPERFFSASVTHLPHFLLISLDNILTCAEVYIPKLPPGTLATETGQNIDGWVEE